MATNLLPEPDIYDVIRVMHDAAERFVSTTSPHQQEPPYEVEGRIATAAWLFFHAWDELTKLRDRFAPQPILEFGIERSIGVLHTIIEGCVRRWGWDFVRRPDAQAIIGTKLVAYERARQDSLFGPAISWRSDPGVEPHEVADRLAGTARTRGIRPTMSPEKGEAAFHALYDHWDSRPVFSDVKPEITQEESARATRVRDELKAYLFTLISPSELAAKGRQIHESRSLQGPVPTTQPSIEEAPPVDGRKILPGDAAAESEALSATPRFSP